MRLTLCLQTWTYSVCKGLAPTCDSDEDLTQTPLTLLAKYS